MITPSREEALARIAEEYPEHYMGKFCTDAPGWYRTAAEIACGLKLNSPPSRRILDIGCGFGYFLFVCREMGHSILGIDVPDGAIERALGILAVPHELFTIRAFEPLSEHLTGFDLITTFGVMFRHGPAGVPGDYWCWSEYEFLARDLCERLNPGGRWVLRPNRASSTDYDTPNLFDFRQWGATTGEFAEAKVVGPQVIVTPRAT